jgi:flagellar motor switch protein FliM
MQRLFSPNDRVVISQFDSKMGEASGYLRVLVPGTTFGVLLRKLSSNAGHPKTAKTASSSHKLGEKLMECSFPAALSVTAIRLPVDEILAMASGKVCDLGVPVGRPAALTIAGREAFDANPVRQGRKRAAQIGRPRIQALQERIG